ncbi:conserved hypothetical protein [Neorickettsia risticii str. Illinois]|uniref:Uncharacterized protein n=1 Tax=Neorickettsia risticii (strain Illinois) TaxID=434131 RepID=C6V4N8_NEORI|nr:conserved hypothetical protein [Neorickettsia risticii str. Illinois]
MLLGRGSLCIKSITVKVKSQKYRTGFFTIKGRILRPNKA